MSTFRNYSASELNELAKSENPTAVNLILDEATVDFLLGLDRINRPILDSQVESLARSIEDAVLQTVGTLSVTATDGLADGQHRLEAIKSLGCPQSLVATVVFGADLATLDGRS